MAQTQTQGKAVEPRCPFCNLVGADKITGRRLGQAMLLYCSGCGAIHGVVPVAQPASPAAKTPAPSPADERAANRRLPPERLDPAEIERGEPGGIGRLPPAPKRRLIKGKPDPIPRLPPTDPYQKDPDVGISPEEALAAFGPGLGSHGFYTRIGYDKDDPDDDEET